MDNVFLFATRGSLHTLFFFFRRFDGTVTRMPLQKEAEVVKCLLKG